MVNWLPLGLQVHSSDPGPVEKLCTAKTLAPPRAPLSLTAVQHTAVMTFVELAGALEVKNSSRCGEYECLGKLTCRIIQVRLDLALTYHKISLKPFGQRHREHSSRK